LQIRLQIFIQLSPTLPKLCHIKRDYLIHNNMVKMSTIAETHTCRRLRKSLIALLIVVCGKSSQICCFYYPRDAMLTRVIVIATCLSVRPSVTRRYCVKTKKASVMVSSTPGSPKLFSDAKFHHQMLRGPQTRVGRKNSAIFQL